MKLKDILAQQFMVSFSNLLDGGILVLSSKIVKRLKLLNKKFQDEANIYNEMYTSLCKELSNKDEKGEAIIIENRYDIPADKKKILEEKINECMELEIDIGQKIDYKDIEKVKLSVKDLIVLDGVISDPID